MAEVKRKLPPARTSEARQRQLINLALDAAEKQLQNGTASSQLITHFLKMETEKDKLEREKLRQDVELNKAKTEAIKSGKDMEKMMQEAMRVFKAYNGDFQDQDGDDY